jgi:hypothetical protein
MALPADQVPYDVNGNGKLEGAELAKYTADILAGIAASNAATGGPKVGTDVSTEKTKLTTASARALMETAAEANGYMGKFSSADIAQFIKDFNKEQDLQIEKVVTSTASKTTPGATPEAVTATSESVAKTEYPSFFKPAQFASDWVWNKISFADDKTLAAKNLAILSQVRGIIDKFQLMGVSDAEAKAAAKQIAMGKRTIVDYTVELQKKASVEYPQFADRFAKDPTLTTYDIASPIINMVAKTLEVDPSTIKMDNSIVLAYTRYAGADGKGVPPSYYDLLLRTKQLPEYQKTQQANNEARDSATSLAKSLGFGL